MSSSPTTSSQLIVELETVGLRPVLRDGKLKLAGPKDRATPELIERVRTHRAKLIDMLSAAAARDRNPGPEGRWRNDPSIHDLVHYEIANWEQQLRIMGWPEARIWRSAFWPHNTNLPRGLPSVLEPGDHITFADYEFVTIQKRDGNTQRFRREG